MLQVGDRVLTIHTMADSVPPLWVEGVVEYVDDRPPRQRTYRIQVSPRVLRARSLDEIVQIPRTATKDQVQAMLLILNVSPVEN